MQSSNLSSKRANAPEPTRNLDLKPIAVPAQSEVPAKKEEPQLENSDAATTET